MIVKFTLSIGYYNAKREEVFEVDDDMSDEELDQQWQEWAWEKIDGGPHKIED